MNMVMGAFGLRLIVYTIFLNVTEQYQSQVLYGVKIGRSEKLPNHH